MQGLETFFSLIILMMSVVIHEVSHGYMAAFLGDPTAKYAGRLTLNPLKHLDPVGSFLVPILTNALGGVTFGWARPVPYNPYNLRGGQWGPALVGLAGPAANLFLAIFFSAVLHWGVLSGAVLALVQGAILINVILFVFNMMPVFPLDGSKILSAVLPYRYNYIIEFLEQYQLIVILFLVFFLDILISPIVSALYYFLIN